MKTYYLYRHVRLDKNEPFYIGVGAINYSGKTFETRFRRAFDKRRNPIWKKIAAKTLYDIEILFQTKNRQLILNKEKEFIKLYGRIKNNSGTLANITEGGEHGPINYKPSQETIEKLRTNSHRKGKFGDLHPDSKEIFVYKVTGEFVGRFGSYREAGRKLKIDRSNIPLILSGKCRECYGLTFFNEYKGEKIEAIQTINGSSKKVSCFDKNFNKIKTFESMTQASKWANCKLAAISWACQKPQRTHKGFHWQVDPKNTIRN